MLSAKVRGPSSATRGGIFKSLILNNLAIMQSYNPVAVTRCLSIVGNHKESAAIFLLELVEKAKDLLARGGVEIASWLIAKKQRWTKDKCASNGDPLALSAGKFVGPVTRTFLQPYVLQHGRCAMLGFLLCEPLQAKREGHVLKRSKCGQ